MLFDVCLQATDHAILFSPAGEWTKSNISNRDIIRLKLACEAMELDARQSIYFTALNAFGDKGVNTNM